MSPVDHKERADPQLDPYRTEEIQIVDETFRDAMQIRFTAGISKHVRKLIEKCALSCKRYGISSPRGLSLSLCMVFCQQIMSDQGKYMNNRADGVFAREK